jgi:hypothetical protein
MGVWDGKFWGWGIIFILGIITEMLEAFYNDEFHRYNIDELWKYLSLFLKYLKFLFSPFLIINFVFLYFSIKKVNLFF